jgi:hypothetical protein
MQGLMGTLVRKNNSLRFVLTLELINQHAAIQVNAEDLEPIVAQAVGGLSDLYREYQAPAL